MVSRNVCEESLLLDVASPRGWGEVAAYLVGRVLLVDIMANNAAVSGLTDVKERPREDWRDLMDASLDSLFPSTQTALMIRNTGAIINVVSI